MLQMQRKDIQSRPGTIAITRTEFNKKKYAIKEGDYPVGEFCEDASLTLPIYPFMEIDIQDRVIQLICEMLCT